MIKLFLHRIPLVAKAIGLFLILCGVQLLSSFFVLKQSLLVSNVSDLLVFFKFEGLVGVVALSLAITLVIYFDIHFFLKETMKSIKESLTERKLDEAFIDLTKATSFSDVYTHNTKLLNLYKSFDHMKTARLALEVSSIKQLMNNVDAGVVLINKELVVTHINHSGEQFLKLLPGEIIGETVSRKISNEAFLETVNNALKYDQKLIDEAIEIIKGTTLSVSVLPIKDKYGDVVRALVIVKSYIKRTSDNA